MKNIIPKVSVIIPVYKAELYIEQCCRSLFEQTMEEIEYVFVDDCSPDKSVQIIQRTAEQYPHRQGRIKILSHSPNRGVSYSRQQGLDEAQGEFIIHCDSDDWVEPEMYNTMYNIALKEQADVVCCGFTVEYSSGKKIITTYPKKTELRSVVFSLSPLTGSVCNKLVKRSMLQDAGVCFPQGINWGEDFCVSLAGLTLSVKTVLLPDVFYHYWQNEESITHTITMTQCDQLIACVPYVEDFLRILGKSDLYSFQLNYLKFQVKSSLLRRKEVRDCEKWKNTYPECNQDIFKYKCALYFKLASWFITKNLTPLAMMILFMYDLFTKLRK